LLAGDANVREAISDRTIQNGVDQRPSALGAGEGGRSNAMLADAGWAEQSQLTVGPGGDIR